MKVQVNERGSWRDVCEVDPQKTADAIVKAVTGLASIATNRVAWRVVRTEVQPPRVIFHLSARRDRQ